MTYDEALKLANETSELRDSEIDISLPMEQYSLEVYSNNSQTYGLRLPKKIIHDSLSVLIETNPQVGPGDAYVKTKSGNLYYELKSSYTSKSGFYNLTQIRMFEDFDFFLISLFDRTDNFRARYYVIPKDALRKKKMNSMHGNKKVNKVNKNIELKATFTIPEAYDFLGNHNILGGTDYNDLKLYYFELVMGRIMENEIVNPNVKMTNRTTIEAAGFNQGIRKSKTEIYFEVGGQRIMGHSNKQTVLMLIEHIGGDEATKFFPNSILTKNPGEYHNEKIADGYYYNQKLSIRDIRKYMVRGKRKNPQIDVKMFELD